MPIKIIHATNHEDYVPEKKKYSKAKPYIPGICEAYILERDRWWWVNKPEMRECLKEKYGIK